LHQPLNIIVWHDEKYQNSRHVILYDQAIIIFNPQVIRNGIGSNLVQRAGFELEINPVDATTVWVNNRSVNAMVINLRVGQAKAGAKYHCPCISPRQLLLYEVRRH